MSGGDDARMALPPGRLLDIARGSLEVTVAPSAGGRLAQIRFDGLDWLVAHGEHTRAANAWGSFPMVPWEGRVRDGCFNWKGRRYTLPINLGGHAIHGMGFVRPWQVEAQGASQMELSLALPEEARWPFGGRLIQRIEVGERRLRMELTLTAGEQSMPAVLGWHPWFRKPDRLEFEPTRCYPRDEEGIAHLPLIAPPPGPWDDCFLNDRPVVLHRHGQRLRLTSSCRHWVVYDQPSHATCVEPQTGPPDAFNLGLAETVAAGTSASAWFQIDWL